MTDPFLNVRRWCADLLNPNAGLPDVSSLSDDEYRAIHTLWRWTYLQEREPAKSILSVIAADLRTEFGRDNAQRLLYEAADALSEPGEFGP